MWEKIRVTVWIDEFACVRKDTRSRSAVKRKKAFLYFFHPVLVCVRVSMNLHASSLPLDSLSTRVGACLYTSRGAPVYACACNRKPQVCVAAACKQRVLPSFPGRLSLVIPLSLYVCVHTRPPPYVHLIHTYLYL